MARERSRRLERTREASGRVLLAMAARALLLRRHQAVQTVAANRGGQGGPFLPLPHQVALVRRLAHAHNRAEAAQRQQSRARRATRHDASRTSVLARVACVSRRDEALARQAQATRRVEEQSEGARARFRASLATFSLAINVYSTRLLISSSRKNFSLILNPRNLSHNRDFSPKNSIIYSKTLIFAI